MLINQMLFRKGVDILVNALQITRKEAARILTQY
jgi:hypothetical protein